LDRVLVPGRVDVEEGGVRAAVDVADVDRLGVSVHNVTVRGSGPGNLERCIEALPDALHALPDRVAPTEVDPRLGGAVLRSAPRKREFFEVRTDGREVSVEKHRVGPEGRTRVPFTLTREQLGRVVEGAERALGADED
jgi:hypothetical protein